MLAAAAAIAANLWAAAAGDEDELPSRVSTPGADGTGDLLRRVTGGDLTFTAAEIEASSPSQNAARSFRALVLGLERTIRRFSQLAADVNAVSEQVSNRSRVLSRGAGNQVRSTESTANSVQQIGQSIAAVQKSIDQLSLNAEETSASVLQMAASIEEVSRIADTLAEFVEQTAAAIDEMIASIHEVATNTEGFSSFAVQTASTMVEMNSITAEIARSAQNSSSLAADVEEAAREGRQAVLGTVEGMRKIETSVHEARSALTVLSERSEEIGEIVKVIDEIARQTNLLALNAAIIAAQAGERGRGFAVVADEIRDLSERTSRSTDEIRTLISTVQKSIHRASEQMSVGTERVTTGVDLTARASEQLDRILEQTARSREAISEIARATGEQGRGSQAATAAIEEVTRMVQQTAAATQQQSQTSQTIGEQTARVRDYTKHLKRAMEEQASGSRAISRAMENIMGAVSEVRENTSVLGSESDAIVSAMSVVQEGTREINFSVADLNQMSGTLRHESALLTQELQKFRLPSPTSGGHLTTAIVLPTELTLDPVYCQFMALGVIQKAIHENLVQFGEGAELMPALAERWEIFEQGHVYRFHLKDAQFHNGRPVRASDVRDSFLRMLSPKINSPGSWILRAVEGVPEYIEGRAQDCRGILVINDRTLELRLSEPLAFFLQLLALPETAIIPVDEAPSTSDFRLKGTGAGPFRVDRIEEGQFVRVKRFDRYHRSGYPYLDELTFRLDIKSTREAAEEFLAGRLDIASGIPLPLVEQIRSDSALSPYLLDTIQMHTSYLGMDCTRPPFNDVRVRKAVSHAVNKERINERVFSGLGKVAQSVLPPGLIGYDPALKGPAYDPERARQLLTEAGYSDGFAIDYWAWDTDEWNNSGQIALIAEDLAAVGIKVNISMHSVTEMREHLKTPGHGRIFAGNWYADFPDADNFFFMFFHSQGAAIVGINYVDPELDAKIEKARRTNDPEQRAQMYGELNRWSVEESPVVYLFHDRLFVAHRPSARAVRTYLVPPPVRFHDVWMER
jgi:methyl-accepting chemotaxis protein/ABC-type transport system substrate-binding protein